MDHDNDVQTTKPNLRNASAFGRLWTKVHLIKCTYPEEIAVCDTVFRSMVPGFVLEIFAIKLPSCLNFGPNFDVPVPPNYLGGGTLNF